MNLSYRTRRNLQALGIFALVMILVAILVWLVWLLWLDRYVVYSRDGVKIDFSLSAGVSSGELAIEPQAQETIEIYYNEGDNAVNTSTELQQLSGYYATGEMLKEEFETVRDSVYKLSPEDTFMLEVKDIAGKFYYSTGVGEYFADVDRKDVDDLISYLNTSGIYSIAMISTFKDFNYGLNHVNEGLTHSSGRYLYMDDDRCYWLSPTSEGALSYVMRIVMELKSLGFDEVVLSNFCYPDTEDILYSGDRIAAIDSAAKKILQSCGDDSFTVSFAMSEPTLVLPAGRTRLYIENAQPSQVKDLAAEAAIENPAQFAFITEALDTRFDAYGVLRPITSVHFEE